jgi:hypothetical protein
MGLGAVLWVRGAWGSMRRAGGGGLWVLLPGLPSRHLSSPAPVLGHRITCRSCCSTLPA